MTTSTSLEPLTSAQCYVLLRSQQVGRLGVVVDGYPAIFPVNFAMDGYTVVLRSRPGSKLIAAEHANVTFQVDSIDPGTRSGWSILVRGQAEVVGAGHGDGAPASTVSTRLQPWVPLEDGGHWMRIIAHGISGRRIVTAQPKQCWELGAAAYL